MLKKYLSLLIVISLSILVSSQCSNIEIIEYNNIYKVEDTNIKVKSEIKFNQNINNVELVLNDLNISNLKIKNSNVSYKIENDNALKKLTINSLNNQKFKELTFLIELKKSNNKSRNFFHDANQFFLLPDMDYLPRINNITDKIKYNTVIENSTNYSYIDKEFENTQDFPYIIMGNFKIIQIGNIKAFIPKDFTYDNEKLSLIVKTVERSYKYFNEVYEKPCKEFSKLFFLNRTGGHSFHSGIILDQNYIREDAKFNNHLKSLIAHEVSHLWWGNCVKSNQSSLIEGLAEYSAGLYMNDVEKYSSVKTYSIKNNELEINTLSKIRFDTITPINTNIYRSFSYIKLPIILNELENTIGKSEIKKFLKELFFEFESTQNLITYKDIIESLNDNNAKIRLNNQLIDQKEENWIDIHIKLVSENIVTYQLDNFSKDYIEKIPVKIFGEENNSIDDILVFKEDRELQKKYPFKIKKVIIDPEFKINQLSCINDVYDVDQLDIFDSKYIRLYEDKFYTFSNNLIKYLFYKGSPSLIIEKNSFDIRKLNSILVTTQKIKTNGFLLYVDEKEKTFKILVNFVVSDKNANGYISGSYIEQNDNIVLNTIDRIKL